MNEAHLSVAVVAAALLAATACGGPEDFVFAEADFGLAAEECGAICRDPVSVVSAPFTGGGAAVDTSSTAAIPKAQQAAKDSACAAAKRSVEPPPCADPTNCKAYSNETCTYANLDCPVNDTWGNDPSAWVAACQASGEPQAWKDAHCSIGGGPGGKPAYVLCTVDATATAATECKPRRIIVCAEPEPIRDVTASEASDVAEENP